MLAITNLKTFYHFIIIDNMGNKVKTNDETGAKKKSTSVFLLNYLFFTALTLILISYQPIKNIIDVNGLYSNALVIITCKFNELIGAACKAKEAFIMLPGLTLEVKFGCNGLEAFLMYAIAVLVFPARVREKIAGVFLGFIFLQILNVLRIFMLAYVGVHYRKYFDLFHFYIAQGLMIAIALGLLILYLNYVTSKKYLFN